MYKVEFGVDHDDLEKYNLIKYLKSYPAKIFGEPYGGYLLFLITGYDNEMITWLQKNIVNLDSLTGREIAAAIFVKNFNLKINDRCIGMQKSYREKKIFSLPVGVVNDAASVTELVTSGKSDWALEGDEINAITYGTDEIARGLGVINELPCMVVLDTIPKNFEVVNLNSENIIPMFNVLRRCKQRLLDRPNYDKFMSSTKEIYYLQQEIDERNNNIKNLELICMGPDYENIKNAIKNHFYFRDSQQLFSGLIAHLFSRDLSKKKLVQLYKFYLFKSGIDKSCHYCCFRRGCLHGRCRMQDKEICENGDACLTLKAASYVNNHIEELRMYNATIYRLSQYAANYKWPLEETSQSQYLKVYQKYVCKLLGDLPENPQLDSSNSCQDLLEKLVIKRNSLVGPIIKQITTSTLHVLRERQSLSNAKLQDNINKIKNFESPSFSDCFNKECKNERIQSATRQICDSAAIYARSWLRPEILLEIISRLPK